MNLRKLGQSDLKITPIGIGAWAIGGGKWECAWGAQDEAECVVAIHAGLDRGINWIDTAAVYGLGHSEEVVGRAVRGLSKRPYVFTKSSLVWDDGFWSAQRRHDATEDYGPSRRRLAQTEHE